MKPIKRTNEMLVYDLMNYSPHGELCQVFIVEAIRYYSEQIIKQDRPPETDAASIDPAKWWDIAADNMNRITENFKEGTE